MPERIVIKIGGATLFQRDGCSSDLLALLAHFRDSQVWVIVGGGELIESMRTVHRLVPELSEEKMHWRCVELLDHTWSIANEIFPDGISIASREELMHASTTRELAGVYWVRVQSYYSRSSIESLPSSWQPESNWGTTTDSLAWLLGKIIDADRVILIKQCTCDPSWTLSKAAELGVIDPELPRLANANPGNGPNVELWQLARPHA